MLRGADAANYTRRPGITIVCDVVVGEGVRRALTGLEPWIARTISDTLHGVQADTLVANAVGAGAAERPEVDVASCDGNIVDGAGYWNREAIDIAHVDIIGTGGAPFDQAIGGTDSAADTLL